jgi:hypothetical protein
VREDDVVENSGVRGDGASVVGAERDGVEEWCLKLKWVLEVTREDGW